MANHEYAHCDNCLSFNKSNTTDFGTCRSDKVDSDKVNKKAWCENHFDRNILNANCMSIEYDLRKTYSLHSNSMTKSLDEFLKVFKWDGVTRLREKWPDEKLAELLINHAETGRDRESDYPSIKEEEEISNLEYLIETRI